MEHKTFVFILYLVAVLPATILFLHFYLPWAGKIINSLLVRLLFLNLGTFICFLPLYFVDKEFGFMYISLHIGVVGVLNMLGVPCVLRLVYPNNLSEVELFLETNSDFSLKESGLRHRLQKYAKLFYKKAEISHSEYFFTCFFMVPFPSIILNELVSHLSIYLFFVAFIPLYYIATFYSKVSDFKEN